jgi:hypothetical protein
MAPPAVADIEQPDCVAAGVVGPSSSHGGRASTDGRPAGEVRSATLRTIKRRRPGPGLRPLSPAVAVVRARPDSALACRPEQARGGAAVGRSHPGECERRVHDAAQRARALAVRGFQMPRPAKS